MIVDENEAKTKICKRILVWERKGYSELSGKYVEVPLYCIGSKCMKWDWIKDEKGNFCGRCGRST